MMRRCFQVFEKFFRAAPESVAKYVYFLFFRYILGFEKNIATQKQNPSEALLPIFHPE